MRDKLAEVVDLFESGAAQVQFHGEEDPSVKEYPFLKSYIPTIGDTVLLKSVGDSYVIMGAIRYKLPPVDEFKELTETGKLKVLEVENDIGFFGVAPTGKKTINTIPADSSVATCVTVINNLINALKAYGLF